MAPFRYLRDPLFLLGTGSYGLNRWVLKPHWRTGFLHSHFNDLWLIPCALPLVLWVHRQLGLRPHDDPPGSVEILSHLVGWAVLFEWLGPKFVRHATSDPWDALAYAAGTGLAALWWQRARWWRWLHSRPFAALASPSLKPAVTPTGHELR